MTEKIELFYQRRAKDMTDWLFDQKVFNPEFTRDNLLSIENYLAFEFQSTANSAKRCVELVHQLKKRTS